MIVIVVSLFLCFDFKAFNYVFNFPFLYAVVFIILYLYFCFTGIYKKWNICLV